MKDSDASNSLILRQLLIAIVVLLVVYGVDRLGWLRIPKRVVEPGLAYFHRVVDAGVYAAGTPVRTVMFWHGGVGRIADLEERLAKVTVDYAHLCNLEDENKALKSVKGISVSEGVEEVVLGRVVGTEGILSVDKGEIDGVAVGAVVVDGEGLLIGVIGSVSVHRSEVLLPSDLSMKIPVRVVGEKTMGVIAGNGAKAILTEVLQTENLKEGDVLVTTGKDEKFPDGLVVGQVVSLSGDHADVTIGGVVELMAKYDEIVFIKQGIKQ